MSLADELLNLGRELGRTRSPLQRMQMLARSWRSVRRLSPTQRKQLAKAVGAEGMESVLDRIAARKGRVGSSFLVPALEKFKEVDPEALGRLIEVLRDPERRQEVLRQSATAVGEVLGVGEKTEDGPAIEADSDAEAETAFEVEVESGPPAEPAEDAKPRLEPEGSPAAGSDAPPASESPVEEEVEAEIEVEPATEPAAAPPAIAHEPFEPPPAPPLELPRLAERNTEASLARRLAMTRQLLGEFRSWNLDALRSLLAKFDQDWARRRVLSAMLERGIPESTADAVELIASLESRGSRRWCVSYLLHERELSESERQNLLEIL